MSTWLTLYLTAIVLVVVLYRYTWSSAISPTSLGIENMSSDYPVNKEILSYASPVPGPHDHLPSAPIFYRDGDKIYELDPFDFESKTAKLFLRTEAELSKDFHVSRSNAQLSIYAMEQRSQ